MKLGKCLYCDVERQYHFSGKPSPHINMFHLLGAMLQPRFVPVLLYRFSHFCARHHLRSIGKLLSLINFVVFGLEIAMDCEIGPGLYLPHTSGTVIGAKRIGENAVIFQNVTIGAKYPDLNFDQDLRPEIGDNVFIGAGAKILGNIMIENGVSVGANAVVIRSVDSGCFVAGNPAKCIQRKAESE
jgi:serine O-acetyltransferase